MTGSLPELVAESRFPAPVQDPRPARLGLAASLVAHIGLLAALGEFGAHPLPEPEDAPPILVDLIVDIAPETEHVDVLAALNPGRIAEALPPSPLPEVAKAIAPDILAPATSAEPAEPVAAPVTEAPVPAPALVAPVEPNVEAAATADAARAAEAPDDPAELMAVHAEQEAAEAADSPQLLDRAEAPTEELASANDLAAATAGGESAELTAVTADESALSAAPVAVAEQPQAEVVTSSIELAATEALSGESTGLAADPREESVSAAAAADLDEVAMNAAPVATLLLSPLSADPVPPHPAPRPPQPLPIPAVTPDLVATSEPQVLEHAADPPPDIAAPEPAALLRAEAAETILVEVAPGRPEAAPVPEMHAEEAPASVGQVSELLPTSVVDMAPRTDPVDEVAPSATLSNRVQAVAVEPAPAAEAVALVAELRETRAEALAAETPPDSVDEPPFVSASLEVVRPVAAQALPVTARSAAPVPSAAPVAAAAAVPVGGARAAPAARLEPKRARQVTVMRPTAPAAAPAIAPVTGAAPAAAATETAPGSAVAEARPTPLARAALPPALVAVRAGMSAPASLARVSPRAAAAPLVAKTATRIGGRPAAVQDAIPVTSEATELAAGPVAHRVTTGLDPESDIEAVVRFYGCARVSALYEINSGSVTLSGHLRSAADRDDLLDNLARVPGVSRVEAADLHIIGDPYCRVIAFLARPEFVRLDEQRADISAIGDPVQASVDRFEAGTLLELEMIAPDFRSYIYVDYFAVDGNVYHLLPTTTLEEGRFEPNQQFGLGGGYERGLKATIGPPFGLDLILAIGSSEPLFDAVRPTVENAEEYLTALGAAIDDAEARNPDLRLEYAYHLMYTGPAAGQ